MKYISLGTLQIGNNSPLYITTKPYTKLLDVFIKQRDELSLIFEGNYGCLDTYSNNTYDPQKNFSFIVLSGGFINNELVDADYKFFKSVRLQENDFIEYYYIFYKEDKSLDEIRDEKLEDLL